MWGQRVGTEGRPRVIMLTRCHQPLSGGINVLKQLCFSDDWLGR